MKRERKRPNISRIFFFLLFSCLLTFSTPKTRKTAPAVSTNNFFSPTALSRRLNDKKKRKKERRKTASNGGEETGEGGVCSSLLSCQADTFCLFVLCTFSEKTKAGDQTQIDSLRPKTSAPLSARSIPPCRGSR